MTIYEYYDGIEHGFMNAYNHSGAWLWLEHAYAVLQKKLSLSMEEASKEYDREKIIREVLNGRIG